MFASIIVIIAAQFFVDAHVRCPTTITITITITLTITMTITISVTLLLLLPLGLLMLLLERIQAERLKFCLKLINLFFDPVSFF